MSGTIDGDEEDEPAMQAIPSTLLERIIADGVRRTGASREACRVLRAEVVRWPDGGLGCPEPGMHYAQALVMGYWIVLDVQGVRLDYRATRAGHFRLCTDPGATDPLPNDAI
jgi:hypothetical protein